MSQKKILLVGAGSGGHFYPLMAVAESLHGTQDAPKLYYAGPNRYDRDALNTYNIKFVRISAGKRRKYKSILNFFDAFKTFFGVFVAIVKLYIIYPDVILTKGGYTSAPVVLAAIFLRIPIVAHESDTKMGTANKLVFRFAAKFLVTYDELYDEIAGGKVDVEKVGIPIRSELLQPASQNAIGTLGIEPNRPMVFVIGGSQGAERINQYVLESLDELLVDYTIMHQTGANHYDTVRASADQLITNTELRDRYHPKPFFTPQEMNDAYHTASVIISRAGSTSIYEIAIHGKPSILIPIPENISHDQRTNAYAYARTGAAIVIEEENMSDDLLRSEIDRIMQNSELYRQMAQAATAFPNRDAAAHVAARILRIAETH